MVLRQCVSCNSTILGTLPLCECGRVFEDIRQVGGRRFSKYRADLYTKLEAKRMKCNEREKKVLGGDSDSADEHQKQIVFQPKRIPPSVSLRTKTRRSKRKRRTHIKSSQEDHNVRTISLFQSPEEEAARLSRALQEINRRIMGQSMIPDSYSADGCCSCGHVFTEKKLIGGKRFSEYRAELYSRLETKRQKLLLKGSTSVNKEVQGKCSFERPGSLKVQLPRIPNTESIVKRSPGQRSKEAAEGRSKPVIRRSPNPQPQAIKPQLAQAKVLQSLLRRFPSALAEINKRLISQNLLWFTINDRTNTQRLEIPKPNVWRQFSETI